MTHDYVTQPEMYTDAALFTDFHPHIVTFSRKLLLQVTEWNAPSVTSQFSLGLNIVGNI